MLLGAAEWNHDIAARWVELDNPMLSEINQTQEDENNMFFFSFISWDSKTISMNMKQ